MRGAQAVLQNLLTAGGPAKALLFQNTKRLIADCPFRGPATRGLESEMPFKGLDPAPNMPASPGLSTGITARYRHLDIGHGLPGGFHIQ